MLRWKTVRHLNSAVFGLKQQYYCLKNVISHVLEPHGVCCVSDYPVVFGSSSDPSRPRMSDRRPRLRVSFSLLVWIVVVWSLVWEILIFGTGEWLLFWGLSFVACLPQLFQLPWHRSVPESQFISRKTFLRACDLRLQVL